MERILAVKCGLAARGSYGHRQGIIVEKHRTMASKTFDTKNELEAMNWNSKTVNNESRALDSEWNNAVFTATCYSRAIAHRYIEERGISNG